MLFALIYSLVFPSLMSTSVASSSPATNPLAHSTSTAVATGGYHHNVTVSLWGGPGNTWNTEVVASVLGADLTAATYALNCRTDIPASKCTHLQGIITQGPSIHMNREVNKDLSTSVSCTKTVDHGDVRCSVTTEGERTGTVFTVAAKQIRLFPVLVTGGEEKLTILTASAPAPLPTGSSTTGLEQFALSNSERRVDVGKIAVIIAGLVGMALVDV